MKISGRWGACAFDHHVVHPFAINKRVVKTKPSHLDRYNLFLDNNCALWFT